MSRIGQHVIAEEEAGRLEFDEETSTYRKTQIDGVTIAESRHIDRQFTEAQEKPAFALWSVESTLAEVRKEKNKLTREDLFTLQRISETASSLVEQMKGKR